MQEKHNKKGHTNHSGHSILRADTIELVKSGDDYFVRALGIINRSKKKLHLQTYIFIDDTTGNQVIDALINAVKRGVEVDVLVDAFGSFGMSHAGKEKILKGGIKFRKFSPLFVHRRIRFGRRLHHKILLGDENEALIGGINIEDKYHFEGVNSPWLDYAAHITGPVCQYISYICENTWRGRTFSARMKKHAINHNKGIPVMIRQNDWLAKKEGISRSHRKALRNSKESITIIGSYFLPGRRVRKLLRDAAKRNIKIRIILQGVSDVGLVIKASKWWYAWMLRNNIEIYEWSKSILHGKLILVDNNWSSVGSYNINHLSDYASIETNIEVHDPAFCQSVKEEMDRVMNASERITFSDYHHKMTPLQQFSCWISFHVVRFLFALQFALLSKE